MTARRGLGVAVLVLAVALLWWWRGRSAKPSGPHPGAQAPKREAAGSKTPRGSRSRRARRAKAGSVQRPGPQVWAAYVLPPGLERSDVPRPTADPVEVRDPFARAFARERLRALRVTVQGIAVGRDPRALVSGRVMRVGDRIDVFTVESIDRSGVVIRGPGGMRARLRRRVPRRGIPVPERTSPKAREGAR